MTFVLGWCDDDGAFLCADSAASHERAPQALVTSFGELQQVDNNRTVEERAVKILQLTDHVLVAVCGDAGAGLDFAMSVQIRLRTDMPLRTAIDQIPTPADPRSTFILLFAHVEDGRAALLTFRSRERSIEDVGRERFATFGSMPEAKKTLAARLATAVKMHRLSPDARLAGVLVALQAIGMTEYLPQHGVGGAFFGAYLSPQSITWQGDLNYVTYRPGLFRNAPFIRPGEQSAPAEAAVEKIRVLVRDGVGILLSSLSGLPVRVLVPPTNTRSEDELNELVLAAVPPPFRVLIPSVHFGLLSVAFSKAIYIYNPQLRDDGAFSVTQNNGRTVMGAVTELTESLESDTPQGFFELTIVTEVDGAAQMYRIPMPTE